MDNLTLELVEYILGSKNLEMEDVINVASTCKHLRDMVNNSNFIWKNLYYKRWPHFQDMIKNAEVDYLSEIKYIYGIRKRVREILETMPAKFYSMVMISKSDFREWDEFVAEGERTYDYIIDYLRTFLHDECNITSIECVPLFTRGNRTLRYFSLEVIKHLRLEKITESFKEMMSLPEKKQLSERAATIVSQWCQPTAKIEYADVCKRLDDLAKEAIEELSHLNPNHPLFKVQPEMFEKWKTENLDECQYSSGNHNMQVLHAIKITLYKKHKYTGNETMYYQFENSYIEKVLENKCGLPILLSIIFESIARRMGVNCEPMNMPAHFLLRLKPDPEENIVYFIDAFNKGKLFQKGACPYSRNSAAIIPRATVHQILIRMSANLEQSLRFDEITSNDLSFVLQIMELAVLIHPLDFTNLENVGELYMSLGMDTCHIHPLLEAIVAVDYMNPSREYLNKLKNYENHRVSGLPERILNEQPKKRGNRVRYAIGMIMKHRMLEYVGVILNWSPICEESTLWQKRMQVDKLKYKNNQPFYQVLATDITRRYVAQENIEILHEIDNPYFSEELGRHFSHFFINHYVPHPSKEKQYPEDTPVRQTFYRSMLWLN